MMGTWEDWRLTFWVVMFILSLPGACVLAIMGWRMFQDCKEKRRIKNRRLRVVCGQILGK